MSRIRRNKQSRKWQQQQFDLELEAERYWQRRPFWKVYLNY